MNKRVSYIDFLRGIFIVVAHLIHFASISSITWLEQIRFFNYNTISVISVFTMITGFMVQKIYSTKYVEDPQKLTKKLVTKALGFLCIYSLYIFFASYWKQKKITSLYFFVQDHPFYMRIIFIFAFLYLSTVAILYLHKKAKVISKVLLLVIFLYYIQSFKLLPFSINPEQPLLNWGYYQLWPAFIFYYVGYLLANYIDKATTNSHLLIHFLSLLVINYLNFYLASNLYSWRQIVYLVNTVGSLMVLKYLYPYLAKYAKQFTNFVLTLGQYSLHFYVTGNIIITLFNPFRDSTLFIQYRLLVITLVPAILASYTAKARADRASLPD